MAGAVELPPMSAGMILAHEVCITHLMVMGEHAELDEHLNCPRSEEHGRYPE